MTEDACAISTDVININMRVLYDGVMQTITYLDGQYQDKEPNEQPHPP